MRKILYYIFLLIGISFLIIPFEKLNFWMIENNETNFRIVHNIFYGLYSSFITIIILNLFNQISYFISFHKIAGEWDEYESDGEVRFMPTFCFTNKSTAKYKIKYIGGNEFNVICIDRFKTNERIWRGTLHMNRDNRVYGILNYVYTDNGEFGTRKLFLLKKEKDIYFNVIIENDGIQSNVEGPFDRGETHISGQRSIFHIVTPFYPRLVMKKNNSC